MNKRYQVLIVTGGYLDCKWAAEWLKGIDISYCIAADSGLMYIDQLGIKVDCILGDYDSVDEKKLSKYKNNNCNNMKQTEGLANAMNIITFPREKDYTDTHLAIKKAIHVIKERKSLQNQAAFNAELTEESFEIIILGGIGTRLDHTMTNIFCMSEAYDAGIHCYMIDKYNKIYLCSGEHTIIKKEQYGLFVSILPVTQEVILTLRGMKYNLSHFCLKQGVSVCQSNEIEKDVAQIIVEKGKIIVYETKD